MKRGDEEVGEGKDGRGKKMRENGRKRAGRQKSRKGEPAETLTRTANVTLR